MKIRKVPFKIGDFVQVASATDETLSKKFIGRKGKIIHFDYACGCGQSYPSDPMIGVFFSNGAIEEFWCEELIYVR